VFADGQCCVKQDDREVRISIEDLAWAVIDTPQASLASALMAACMEAGVAIVLATRHTLSGLVLPFHRHHRQSVIARLQADAKDSLKKRLRQEMVRRQILNQSAVLVAVLRFRLIHQAGIRGIPGRCAGSQPTTGKSVGKPRRRNTNPQQTCEPTTRKSVGKPASQMRMEAETGTRVTLRPQRQTFACETAKAPRTVGGNAIAFVSC
jgi:hypothetical protein